jgi:hypothetical protein
LKFIVALFGSVAEVVAEQAAEPMRAPDSSGRISGSHRRFDQLVSQTLMVALGPYYGLNKTVRPFRS